MATLRTVPTTKDGVSVSGALERETDLTPFDFSHNVFGTVLYGVYQDLLTNGPTIPLVISAVKDQDGKPMLLTRSSIREEGTLVYRNVDTVNHVAAPDRTVLYTVPAGKLATIKAFYLYFAGTYTNARVTLCPPGTTTEFPFASITSTIASVPFTTTVNTQFPAGWTIQVMADVTVAGACQAYITVLEVNV